MISVSDVILTGFIAVAAGVSLASVAPIKAPKYTSYTDPYSIELPIEYLASPTISNSARLDVVQEKLEVQSVRIQEIDRKLNLLLSPGIQGDVRPKGR